MCAGEEFLLKEELFCLESPSIVVICLALGNKSVVLNSFKCLLVRNFHLLNLTVSRVTVRISNDLFYSQPLIIDFIHIKVYDQIVKEVFF